MLLKIAIPTATKDETVIVLMGASLFERLADALAQLIETSAHSPRRG